MTGERAAVPGGTPVFGADGPPPGRDELGELTARAAASIGSAEPPEPASAPARKLLHHGRRLAVWLLRFGPASAGPERVDPGDVVAVTVVSGRLHVRRRGGGHLVLGPADTATFAPGEIHSLSGGGEPAVGVLARSAPVPDATADGPHAVLHRAA